MALVNSLWKWWVVLHLCAHLAFKSVNGIGCCLAARGQMERMSLTLLLLFIGVVQALDGGQLVHSDLYPRLYPATAFLPVHLPFLLLALSLFCSYSILSQFSQILLVTKSDLI